MKQILVRTFLPFAKLIARCFFDKRYIRGRFFEQSHGGYLWAMRAIWSRNILRLGTVFPWPVALGCHISKPQNVVFHPDDLNNFQTNGTYFQCNDAEIVIGRGTYIAPNVGLITSNHNLENLSAHQKGKSIVLGEGCWVGMNCVILPGVRLGAGTVVAAGSVVTKSFEQGNVTLTGAPAKVIRINSVQEQPKS